jgi:hypothetical protein
MITDKNIASTEEYIRTAVIGDNTRKILQLYGKLKDTTDDYIRIAEGANISDADASIEEFIDSEEKMELLIIKLLKGSIDEAMSENVITEI